MQKRSMIGCLDEKDFRGAETFHRSLGDHLIETFGADRLLEQRRVHLGDIDPAVVL